jgi:ferredoxin
MHVEIDPRRCCGYRLCVEVAPDLFEVTSTGKAQLRVEDVAPERHEALRRTVRECPQDAIRISGQ